MFLTRPFSEYCIWGWDNLPRTALMYYTNFVSSCEGYFQTVICNSREFRNTTVNSDLHFIQWDTPPLQVGWGWEGMGMGFKKESTNPFRYMRFARS